MHSLKLFFFYTKGYDKNQYISVVNDTIHLTFSYKETCLYTEKELENVKSFLDKEKLSYKVGEATSVNTPPEKFRLNEKIIFPFNFSEEAQ